MYNIFIMFLRVHIVLEVHVRELERHSQLEYKFQLVHVNS